MLIKSHGCRSHIKTRPRHTMKQIMRVTSDVDDDDDEASCTRRHLDRTEISPAKSVILLEVFPSILQTFSPGISPKISPRIPSVIYPGNPPEIFSAIFSRDFSRKPILCFLQKLFQGFCFRNSSRDLPGYSSNNSGKNTSRDFSRDLSRDSFQNFCQKFLQEFLRKPFRDFLFFFSYRFLLELLLVFI